MSPQINSYINNTPPLFNHFNAGPMPLQQTVGLPYVTQGSNLPGYQQFGHYGPHPSPYTGTMGQNFTGARSSTTPHPLATNGAPMGQPLGSPSGSNPFRRQTYLSAYPRYGIPLSLSDINAGMEMFRRVKRYQDRMLDDPFTFLEGLNRAARITGFSEEEVKLCFIDAVDYPRETWAPGLDPNIHSLNDFVVAFLSEFFSADAQKTLKNRFFSTNAPKGRSEFISFCDQWYVKLTRLVKPPMDHESIISNLINKVPNRNLVLILRGYRDLPYFAFRDKLRLHWQEDDSYRTFGANQYKSTPQQYQKAVGLAPYNKPPENAIRYLSEPTTQAAVSNISYNQSQSQYEEYKPQSQSNSQEANNYRPNKSKYPNNRRNQQNQGTNRQGNNVQQKRQTQEQLSENIQPNSIPETFDTSRNNSGN